MTLISVLKEYPIHQLGASQGNYLQFDKSSQHWSVVKLNCVKRLIRWLRLGYYSTRLEFIAKNLSLTPETNIDADVLKTIHAIWKKAFPTVTCPHLLQTIKPLHHPEPLISKLSQKKSAPIMASVSISNFTAPTSIAPSNKLIAEQAQVKAVEVIEIGSTSSLIEEAPEVTPPVPTDPLNLDPVQNNATVLVKVGNTSIAIQGGGFAKAGVTCILFPIVRKSCSFILTPIMEEALEELSTAVGYNMKEGIKTLYADPTATEAALPSITDGEALVYQKLTRILLPLFPLVPFSEKDQDGVRRCGEFLISCLDLAKSEGVRNFAFSPLNFNRSQNSEWTRVDFEVIETYVQENPEAFDIIKLIYKSDTEESAANLNEAISICKTMEHPYGKISI